MKILLSICFVSSIILFAILFVLSVLFFFTGIYSCFSKKTPGKLIAKLAVTFFIGSICPWLLFFDLHLIQLFKQMLM